MMLFQGLFKAHAAVRLRLRRLVGINKSCVI